MKHKHFSRIISLLLTAATLFSLFTLPASAASLNDSGTVTIQQAGYGNYLSKSTGGTIGGGYRLLRQLGLKGRVPVQGPDGAGVQPQPADDGRICGRLPQPDAGTV